MEKYVYILSKKKGLNIVSQIRHAEGDSHTVGALFQTPDQAGTLFKHLFSQRDALLSSKERVK